MIARLGLSFVVLCGACATPTEVTRSEAPAAVTPAPLDAGAASLNRAPSTRTQVIQETLHGVSVSDPYRWLEEDDAPEVQTWMKAQDTYARTQLAALPGRDRLKARLTELLVVDSQALPTKRGNRFFFERRTVGQERYALVWREADGTEKVLLDPNTWNPTTPTSLGQWSASIDGKKVAFTENPNAADAATLFVIDVDTGKRSEIDVIRGAKYAGVSWASDSKSFVYTWLPDDPTIPAPQLSSYAEVRHHVLGKDPKTDAVLHPKTGSTEHFVSGGVSEDGQYLIINKSHGWHENSIWFKRFGAPGPLTLLVEGHDATYTVDAFKGRLFVLTNEGAPNSQLFSVDPAKPARAQWKSIVPEDPKAVREGFSLVGGQLAVSSLQNIVSHLEIFTLEGKKVREIELPGLGTLGSLSGSAKSDDLFFSFSSFVEPYQVLKASVATGVTSVWSKVQVPVDTSKYEVKQVSFPSKDGTAISMFIVARKGLVLDGSSPALLGGYGGFSVSVTNSFKGEVYAWLEAGGVYASVNLRGGGEYGSKWHDAGKLANKQNVFDDFAAAAQFLVAQKYTTAKRLGIQGRSNGGLLVGAAMTQHPELYGAVICGVPLLDMVRYHLSGSGPTWVPEYGSPEKPEEFKVLEAYSPYHHVNEKAVYPPMLMTSSDHDDRVAPLHARKFVARVQQAHGTAWLRIETAAGHKGADQVSKRVEQMADEYAFLFETLGVNSK